MLVAMPRPMRRRGCPAARALAACCLPLLALGEEVDCEDHPGGCRCYYDALANGCPSSLGHDSKMMLCSCSYGDNTWLSVLTQFIWAFSTDASQRHLLADKFAARVQPDGVLSMDVGYGRRIECAAPLAKVYPGTNFQLDIDELYQLAGNVFYPDVHNKLRELCVPGRLALQLLCLHAELGLRDGAAAAAYAREARRIWQMVGQCTQTKTPWPFPGLTEYLTSWKKAELPQDGSPLSAEAASRLSWWPAPGTMRGKRPEESENHYWPCVPLQDRACFPPGQDNAYTSCENCCDPGKGPTGDPACFVGEWTFQRCCRTPGGVGRFY